jgi:NAD kinase
MQIENIVIIVNKTRLEQLIERFNTRSQAKFYIEHAGGDFKDYEVEHETFHRSLDQVIKMVHQYSKCKVVERKYLPNFLFNEKDGVVVVGQDGLVANTAKYSGEQPILAINPDVKRYDGILLPFTLENFEKGLASLMKGSASFKRVTMAEAQTNDGQRLLAFNDLFIGPSSHTSARYKISYHGKFENQSSSGIVVSTGAGSTGWLSSLLNMSNGIQTAFNVSTSRKLKLTMDWDSDQLVFVVREPFQSRYSTIDLSAGMIRHEEKLVIESYMPTHGVIFSDGIETDYLSFNSGTKVEIRMADQKAVLVI